MTEERRDALVASIVARKGDVTALNGALHFGFDDDHDKLFYAGQPVLIGVGQEEMLYEEYDNGMHTPSRRNNE